MFMKTAPTCQFLSCRLDFSWLRLPGVRLGFMSVTPDPAAAPSRKRITFLFRDSAATAFVTSILALFHSEIKTILDFFIIYLQSPFRNFKISVKSMHGTRFCVILCAEKPACGRRSFSVYRAAASKTGATRLRFRRIFCTSQQIELYSKAEKLYNKSGIRSGSAGLRHSGSVLPLCG